MGEIENGAARARAAELEALVAFWLEAGPEAWYKQDDAFDEECRTRFLDLWEAGARGDLDQLNTAPRRALGLILLFDQLPRNMFRGDARAFSTDAKARKLACYAVDHEWDLKIEVPERQFFYMPFVHSERLTDQDRAVRLMQDRLKAEGNLIHARVHREIIRRFNRFPYRNEALGRETTEAERTFLEGEGYSGIMAKFQSDG